MNKIFCPHVFNALEVTTSGKFKPCCISSYKFKDNNKKEFSADKNSVNEVYHSEDRKWFIDHFDDLFKTECKQCFEVEQGGGESKRLREINYWKMHYNSSTIPVFDNDRELEVLDLKLGNTCNLACATCGPDSSSKWNSIYKSLLGNYGWPVQNWQNTDVFWESLTEDLSKIKKIEIAGGEPFMNKKQKILLKYLVDNDFAKNIDIAWITNCTQYDQEIINLLPNFKFVRIMLSLDNTKTQFEYMRYPAKWDESYEIFLKFKRLQENNIIDLGISHTISALNVWHLKEFWEWSKEHRVNVFNNLVIWPFHCKNLPYDFKLKVKEKLESNVSTDYQTNPAAGKENWLVKFLMQDPEKQELMISHLEFVKKSRPNGLFEKAFPELIGVL